jgi:hypothetical protein
VARVEGLTEPLVQATGHAARTRGCRMVHAVSQPIAGDGFWTPRGRGPALRSPIAFAGGRGASGRRPRADVGSRSTLRVGLRTSGAGALGRAGPIAPVGEDAPLHGPRRRRGRSRSGAGARRR